MTVQNRVNFVFLFAVLIYVLYVMSAISFYNLNICLVKMLNIYAATLA